MKLMQKGSAQLFLVIAAFVIAAFLGIIFLQKPAPKLTPQNQPVTENYSNAEFGFGFKYSKELIAKSDTEDEFNKRGNGDFRKNFKGYVGYEPPRFLGAAAVLGKDENYETNPFSVWIFNNDNNLAIEKWFKDYWYYPYLWGVFDWTSKGHVTPDSEATVSGQQAKYRVVSYQPGKPKFVYISKNQKMYLFRIIGETGDKILSSFKFLK